MTRVLLQLTPYYGVRYYIDRAVVLSNSNSYNFVYLKISS